MEQDQNTTQPSVGNAFPTEAKSGIEKSMIIGGIVVVLVAIGAWYMMMQPQTVPQDGDTMTPAEQTQMESAEDASAAAEAAAVTAALSAQSSSDDLSAIDADLTATDMSALGDPSSL